MEIISEKTYNVMDEEPHLGKQIESVVRVDREEYMEGLVDAFINGANETTDTFEIESVSLGVTQLYTLGCDLTESDIVNIRLEMDMHLLDDDYGSGKDYDLVYELLDDLIPDNWQDEFEMIEMRGY